MHMYTDKYYDIKLSVRNDFIKHAISSKILNIYRLGLIPLITNVCTTFAFSQEISIDVAMFHANN